MIPEAPAPGVLDVLTGVVGRGDVRRVLEIGTGRGDAALAVVAVLRERGMLITVEHDPETARQARQRLLTAGVAGSVSVIVGDASRYLHKLAGPFDVIFQNGDTALYESMRDRLVALLAPSGTLVSNNVNEAGDYNKRLAADPRLTSTFLPVGNGLVISVNTAGRVSTESKREDGGLSPLD